MFKGVVGFITGGASGLGKATVQRIVREGGKAVIVDLPTSEGEKLSEELGDSTIFTPADVSSEADIKAALDDCKKIFGRLDVSVNCAGISFAFKIYNHANQKVHSLEDFENVLKVDTLGTFNVIRLSAALMDENEPNENGDKGVIVNTASFAAFDGQIAQATHSASKGAVVGMTLPIARDLSSIGVRVNTIAAGLFTTPLISYMPEKVLSCFASQVLTPSRLGNPDDFAHMVQNIVRNPYINGEVVRLDGGLRLTLEH